MKSLVVGNGLIARSFRDAKFSGDTVVVASGVSNSAEFRRSEFSRERRLIRDTIAANKDSTIVYFSTTSLFSKIKTPYVNHKIEMEQLVVSSAKSFYIFRLPQVVGFVRNNTLVSYFVDSIINGRPLVVQREAKRNLLDIDDLTRVVCHSIENRVGINSTQNISSAVCVPVWKIVEEIFSILKRRSEYELVDSGVDQCVDTSFLLGVFGRGDPLFSSDYWRDVLRKYVPSIPTIGG